MVIYLDYNVKRLQLTKERLKTLRLHIYEYAHIRNYRKPNVANKKYQVKPAEHDGTTTTCTDSFPLQISCE